MRDAVTSETVELPCTVRHATAVAVIKRMIAARFAAIRPDEVQLLSTCRVSEIRDWRVSGLRRENGTGRTRRFEMTLRCDVPVGADHAETRERLTAAVERATLSEVVHLRWEPVSEAPRATPPARTVEPSSPTLLAERFGQALIAAKGGVV